MSVGELARAAELDTDETLILLWEAGLDQYTDPRDRLRRQDTDAALRAVGLATGRELTDPSYWMKRLLLDDENLRRLLSELGTPMGRHARSLPKGSVAKLRHYANRAAMPSPENVRQAEEVVPTVERFSWRTVGHERDVRLLSVEEVEGIHWELVRDFAQTADPIAPPGIMDRGLLASAVFRQHTSLGETAKYPTVEMAAAALFHALVHNHPFFNGNKRTALVSMLVLLDENGVMPTCDEDELFRLVLRLAQHRLVPPGEELTDREAIHLAEWLHARSRNVEKGERPIQWRKVQQILRSFECELSHPAGVGNRMNVHRTVDQAGLFGRTKRRVLSTQVTYTDDGREALVGTVKKIRRDLWLDDEHGVDSLDFYQRGGPSPTGFIVKYRKTLRRLARL